MEQVENRELQARDYLEKHRIMELLHHLTSVLLFVRPPKPREYLISLLERLRIAKATGVAFPFFLDNSNIVAMFDMMDPSGRGTISFAQYKEALKNLGLCPVDEVLSDDGHVITLNKFQDEVGKPRHFSKDEAKALILELPEKLWTLHMDGKECKDLGNMEGILVTP